MFCCAASQVAAALNLVSVGLMPRLRMERIAQLVVRTADTVEGGTGEKAPLLAEVSVVSW